MPEFRARSSNQSGDIDVSSWKHPNMNLPGPINKYKLIACMCTLIYQQKHLFHSLHYYPMVHRSYYFRLDNPNFIKILRYSPLS